MAEGGLPEESKDDFLNGQALFHSKLEPGLASSTQVQQLWVLTHMCEVIS